MIRAHRGFTLIELLVVVAIIGLLSSVVLGSLSSARAAARDAQRVADMRALDSALKAHIAERGAPLAATAHHSSVANCRAGTEAEWSAGLGSLVTNRYIAALPRDPSGGCYTYSRTTGSVWTCGGDSINDFQYALFFQTERAQTNYRASGQQGGAANNQYCILGPRR